MISICTYGCKGVEYTHRGVYLACMANIIESGLNIQSPLAKERAKCVVTYIVPEAPTNLFTNRHRSFWQISLHTPLLPCHRLDSILVCCSCERVPWLFLFPFCDWVHLLNDSICIERIIPFARLTTLTSGIFSSLRALLTSMPLLRSTPSCVQIPILSSSQAP